MPPSYFSLKVTTYKILRSYIFMSLFIKFESILKIRDRAIKWFEDGEYYCRGGGGGGGGGVNSKALLTFFFYL